MHHVMPNLQWLLLSPPNRCAYNTSARDATRSQTLRLHLMQVCYWNLLQLGAALVRAEILDQVRCSSTGSTAASSLQHAHATGVPPTRARALWSACGPLSSVQSCNHSSLYSLLLQDKAEELLQGFSDIMTDVYQEKMGQKMVRILFRPVNCASLCMCLRHNSMCCPAEHRVHIAPTPLRGQKASKRGVLAVVQVGNVDCPRSLTCPL